VACRAHVQWLHGGCKELGVRHVQVCGAHVEVAHHQDRLACRKEGGNMKEFFTTREKEDTAAWDMFVAYLPAGRGECERV
jgi:ribosomal protein S27AE